MASPTNPQLSAYDRLSGTHTLTQPQQQTASELPWYRQWLLEHGYTEDDLIPFAVA